MKRQFPGLHSGSKNGDGLLEGVFLVRVDRAFYSSHSEKPFFAFRFTILEPKEYSAQTIAGRLYCTSKALWKLSWFLRDFGYDPDLLSRDEVDEQSLVGLIGMLKTSRTTLRGRSFLNLESFAPAGDWERYMLPTTAETYGFAEDGRGL